MTTEDVLFRLQTMAFINDFKKSITYPFDDEEWLKKIWPLPLIALVPIIGLLSVILLKGWRFETVISLRESKNKLPEFDFVTFLLRGTFLWCAMLSYLIVPAIICSLLGIGGFIGFIVDIFSIFTNGFGSWLENEPMDWGMTIVVYLLWGIISYPIYQAGMVRYALTGRWVEVFNIPLNFLTLLRNIHYFIKYYIFWFIISVLLAIVDSTLAFTGIALLVLPALTVSIYYSTTAYELSHLVQKIEARRQKRRSYLLGS